MVKLRDGKTAWKAKKLQGKFSLTGTSKKSVSVRLGLN